MHRTMLCSLAAVLLVFAVAPAAEARGRRRAAASVRSAAAASPRFRARASIDSHGAYDVNYSPGSFYPKYIGGFHARYFEQYGYPTGGVGLRGWAW